MPGKSISLITRQWIFRFLFHLNRSPDEIYAELFEDNENTSVTIKYLRRLCFRLTHDIQFRIRYMAGPQSPTGRPRSLESNERRFLFSMLARKPNYRVGKLARDFLHLYYGEHPLQNGPNERTILRVLHRADFSRKVMEHRHYLRDDGEGVDYLKRIAHIDPLNFIDIDETASCPESFRERFGWSPVGDECIQQQIIIGNRSFSTIAAVTPFGFIAWEIFDKIITQEEFSSFITNKVRPLIEDNTIALLDNCSIHKAPLSRQALQDTFTEDYIYCPKYSPHLKPIETCFSMIKNEIRKDETAELNPVVAINNAFRKYSRGQPQASLVYNHWKGYFINHANYIEELENV